MIQSIDKENMCESFENSESFVIERKKLVLYIFVQANKKKYFETIPLSSKTVKTKKFVLTRENTKKKLVCYDPVDSLLPFIKRYRCVVCND